MQLWRILEIIGVWGWNLLWILALFCHLLRYLTLLTLLSHFLRRTLELKSEYFCGNRSVRDILRVHLCLRLLLGLEMVWLFGTGPWKGSDWGVSVTEGHSQVPLLLFRGSTVYCVGWESQLLEFLELLLIISSGEGNEALLILVWGSRWLRPLFLVMDHCAFILIINNMIRLIVYGIQNKLLLLGAFVIEEGGLLTLPRLHLLLSRSTPLVAPRCLCRPHDSGCGIGRGTQFGDVEVEGGCRGCLRWLYVVFFLFFEAFLTPFCEKSLDFWVLLR